jgi:hypothetical protein
VRRRRHWTAASLALLLAASLAGCGDDPKKRSVGQQPLGGTPETAPPSPGGPIPFVAPTSPEPSSAIEGDLPPADRPGAGATGCPTPQQLVEAYRGHLRELGVTPGSYSVVRRSPCASGWASATLREGAGGQPFVVVLGPNIRGKVLAVVADGTDRDKGEPCAVAARSAAPEAIMGFCRSAT